METRFLAESPNDITFTLKITAAASEFFELRDELQRYGQRALPAPMTAQLTQELSNLLAASRKVMYPADGEKPQVIGSFAGHAISADPSMPDDIKASFRDAIRRATTSD